MHRESYDNGSDEVSALSEQIPELLLRDHIRHNAVQELHPLPESDAFLTSVQPPKMPAHGLERAQCDIVLVIDVSGSMSSAAPMLEAEDDNDKAAAGDDSGDSSCW